MLRRDVLAASKHKNSPFCLFAIATYSSIDSGIIETKQTNNNGESVFVVLLACLLFIRSFLKVDHPDHIVDWLNEPVTKAEIVRRENHRVRLFVVEETELRLGMLVVEAFRGVDGKCPLQCGKLGVARQILGQHFSFRGVCHDNLFELVFVHPINLLDGEASSFTSLIGGGEEGHKHNIITVSRKHVPEPGPLHHRAKVAEVVDRTEVVVY